MEKYLKRFNIPLMEIINFENSDIITLSRGDEIYDGGDNEEIFTE